MIGRLAFEVVFQFSGDQRLVGCCTEPPGCTALPGRRRSVSPNSNLQLVTSPPPASATEPETVVVAGRFAGDRVGDHGALPFLDPVRAGAGEEDRVGRVVDRDPVDAAARFFAEGLEQRARRRVVGRDLRGARRCRRHAWSR